MTTFNDDFTSKMNYDLETTKRLNEIINPVDFSAPSPDLSLPADTLKTLTAGLLGFIPVVGATASLLCDTVWTNLLEKREKQTEFSEFRDQIKDLISQSLIEYDFVKVSSKFKATKTKLTNFKNAIANLKPKPKNESLREEVRAKFNQLEDGYIDAIADSSTAGYESVELPLYAMFCHGYLLLCRDMVLNGKKWGFNEATIATYKAKLTTDKIEYTKYCKETFDKEMVNIKSVIAPKNDITTFNKLLTFKSIMMVNVFDYCQMWDAMDLNLFPDGCKVEFVRYAFTPIVGLPVNDVDDSNYYYRSCDALIKWWADSHTETYKKELLQMNWYKESSTNNYFIAFNCVYSDKLLSGEKKTGLFGGTNLRDEQVNTLTFNGQEQTVTLGGDFLPRIVKFSSTTNSHMIQEPYKIMWPASERSLKTDYYFHSRYPTVHSQSPHYWFPTAPSDSSLLSVAPTSSDVCVRRSSDNTQTFGFKNHKVGTAIAFNSNIDKYLSLFTPNNGFLDSIGIGFIPVSLHRTNIVNPTGITIINCQKYFSNSASPYVADFFNPFYYLNYIEIKPSYLLTYSFDIPVGSTQFIYKMTLRTNAKSDSKVLVKNKKGVENGTIKITAGDNVDSQSTFNINIGKGLNQNHFTLWVQVFDATIQLISIILTPVITPIVAA